MADVNPGNPEDDATWTTAGPGRQVGQGRFTLERLLGQGAMGAVWLAEDVRLKERVALKFVPPAVRHDPAALDGLRRETRRSHQLAHPHIIRIHDFHEPPNEEPFISMEFVEGRTLSEVRWGEPQKCLSWERLLPWARQLCEALDYAHGEGVVHRDLKPANLLLDAKSRLKLADFGLATVIHESMSRASGHVTLGGTLAYMSPQQMAGKPPTPADDIYSLGVTLYELLASHPPLFRGDISYQVVHEAPASIQERQAEFGIHNPIPPRVAETILRCLEKDPGRRPTSAGEIQRQLDHGSARPKPQPERATRRLRQRVGAGALLVLIVAVVAFALRRPGVEQSARKADSDTPAFAPRSSNPPVASQRVLLTEDFENFGLPESSKRWSWRATLGNWGESVGKSIVTEHGNRYLRLTNGKLGDRLIRATLELPDEWEEITVTFRMRTRDLSPSESYIFSGAKVGLEWLTEDGRRLHTGGSSPPVRKDAAWHHERCALRREEVPGARFLKVYPFLHQSAGTAEFDDIKVVVLVPTPKPAEK